MAYITDIGPLRITFFQSLHSSDTSSQVFSVKYDGMKYCRRLCWAIDSTYLC